jgi:hypothetical protein
MLTPILGQAYTARSVNAADNRCINLYPEVVPDIGMTSGFLNRAPGLKFLKTLGTGPIRGLWDHQTEVNSAYVVSGDRFYKIDNEYNSTFLGQVSGTGPVSIADSGSQIFIAANPEAFVYTDSTGTFTKITSPNFHGAKTVCYIDGYFAFNQPNTQTIWVTNILNGTVIDPLAFGAAESSPDIVNAIVSNNREVWVFGSGTSEVWYNNSTTPFPLAPIQGAYNEVGCVATYTIAKLDNSLFWLGSDPRGAGVIYRNNGYSAVRVSTHAVEYAIQSYSKISDAVAYTYQQEGHSFYVINFPSADTTWVYDVATDAWHERAGWNNGVFTRHRGACQMNFNGQTIIGDFENGNIYAFDLNTYYDNSKPQKWLRSWRALAPNTNEGKRTAQHSLQLMCETGVGLDLGQGSDPQIMLRWSDDGGHTWSNEHWASIGKVGQYGYRAFWRRLGITTKLRDRVYEISGTDPNKIIITGASLLLDGTNG